ncbi:MAG TPA: NPCBM/NEW2 domain-containing protein [Tepidisphaeraceae bacterium]
MAPIDFKLTHCPKFLCFVLVLAMSPFAFADDSWTLTTSDLKTQSVALQGFDEKGATVIPAGAGAARVVPLDRFLEMERTSSGAAAEQQGKLVLYLAGGDRLGGAPVSMAGETLTWKSPAVGEMKLSIRQARALVKAGARPADAEPNQQEDVIKLTNGDSVRGIVINMQPEKITIQPANGDPAPVPMENIISIQFATAGNAPSAPARSFRIRLNDGSSFQAAAATLKDDKIDLTFADKSTRQLDAATVVAIEQLNGPVTWLSSLIPAENVQTPFLELAWPARMDRSVRGEPIRFGEKIFTRGIGVHAYSRLSFALDGKNELFHTRYAIDRSGENSAQYADVTVRIKLDDKIVHEVKNFKAGKLADGVTVPLGAARQLTLEVDYGANYDTQDQFDWIEPALLRKAEAGDAGVKTPAPVAPAAAATNPATRP